MEKEIKFEVKRLSVQEKEMLRRKIVREMKKREKTAEVAEICECSIRHVQSVWKQYRDGGIEAIKTKKIGRPINSGVLSEEQQKELQKIIVDKCPNQLKLKGFLWDRENVRKLIKQKYDIDITLQGISKYMKKWGYTPQRPIKKNMAIPKRQRHNKSEVCTRT